MKTIRILLADDHTIVRKGLRMLLESHEGFQVVAEAADGREAVTLAEQHRPDVIVMDIAMPILNGIEAARQICAKEPQPAIVFLSMHSDEGYVLKALKSGARGYLLKDSAEHDLTNAVRTVHEGKAFFSPAISKMLVEDYIRQMRDQKVEDSYDLLTRASGRCCNCSRKAGATKKWRRMLDLSPHTVETHRGQDHAEAESAQRGGDYPLRDPKGRDQLAAALTQIVEFTRISKTLAANAPSRSRLGLKR